MFYGQNFESYVTLNIETNRVKLHIQRTQSHISIRSPSVVVGREAQFSLHEYLRKILSFSVPCIITERNGVRGETESHRERGRRGGEERVEDGFKYHT